ncbi:hypothetical protein D3C87_2002660 [compost metagenome]
MGGSERQLKAQRLQPDRGHRRELEALLACAGKGPLKVRSVPIVEAGDVVEIRKGEATSQALLSQGLSEIGLTCHRQKRSQGVERRPDWF